MRGFSLIELAIVLVILGLLAAGVTAGTSLVEEARLRGVITDVQKYRTAINNFREQYDALPGDITNASSYWTGTSNGGGNGQISTPEGFRGWQHLGLSGLIDANFTGVAGGGGAADAVVGTNVPASSMEGGGYTLVYSNWWTTDRNHLEFGVDAANDNMTYGGVVNPVQGLSIDQKIDDGTYNAGNVFFSNGIVITGVCISGGAPNTVLTTPICRMNFAVD